MAKLPFNVRLRGVRGSIPTPLSSQDIKKKLLYALVQATAKDLESEESIQNFVKGLPLHIQGCVGGNSACVQMDIGDTHLIFDAGTGCYSLGRDLFKTEFAKGQGRAHWFMTHTHLDHIIGLPMFGPIYVPGNHFTFYSPMKDLEERFVAQQDPRFFPVGFDSLASTIDFVDLSDTPTMNIGDITIKWLKNDHPGNSYSYRVEYEGTSIVLSTDAEYKSLSPDILDPVIDFFHKADMLIFDAQYAFTDSVQLKRDWGHSSSFVGIDLALDSEVKRLVLFHHEPTFDDFKLMQTLTQARKYLRNLEPNSKLEILLGHESLMLEF
jgi:phosphoribosyl 1,2-cyclic phosphodiesterase